MTLKEKTITGLLWSAIDSFANQGVQFLVGIILARLILPKEFGLIGMITIFIAISQTFVNSGFSSALIRKKDCSQSDYSTVFFYNIAMGIFLYLIIFFSAGSISNFFNEPELKSLIRVLALDLIIRSVSLIQSTTLTKQINFKLHAKIAVISGIFSGIIGIVMAFAGFGVWSLVARSLSNSFFISIFLWSWIHWEPKWIFSKKSFKELFGFGSKLLASSLIDTLYNNIYYIVIGKYFTAQQLGYYTRAQAFNDLPSKNLNSIMTRVTFPVLSNLQENKEHLKYAYKKMIKNVMFISMIIMVGMAATAEPMVICLIGEKWRQSIIYLQLLCFPAMMYPLHALNLNILNVQGRSDLFLRIEIIKKILAIPIIFIGILWGIKIMILGMWVNTIIAYYINSYYSGKLINYPLKEQLADIYPALLMALTMGVAVFVTGWIIPVGYLLKLVIQIILGAIIMFGLSESLKFETYLELKEIVRSRLTFINYARL